MADAMPRLGRRSSPGGNRLLMGVWAASLLALVGYAIHVALGPITHGFIAYYAAARLLVTHHLGTQVYDDVWFTQYVQQVTGTHVREIFGPNTPAMALLAVPVVFFEPTIARSLWLLASIAGFALSTAALVRHGAVRNQVVPMAFVVLVLLAPSVFANLRTGQAYMLVFAALTVAGLSLANGREGLAGVMIGLSLLLKSSGLPLLVLLVARGRMRAAATAVLVGIVGAACITPFAGVNIWPSYLSYIWAFVQRPSTSVTAYQATQGLFRHLCIGDATWNPGPAANCAAIAQSAPGLLLVAAVACSVVAARHARAELWVACGVCLSVLAVPIAEEHAFVLLGIPIIFVLQAQTGDVSRRSRTWLAWALCAALLIVPLGYLTRHFAAGWSALAAYPRLYAAWILWALTISAMRGDRANHEPHVAAVTAER